VAVVGVNGSCQFSADTRHSVCIHQMNSRNDAGHHDSAKTIVVVIIIIVIFLAHQHKAAGRKTRLNIQNYGCNGSLLCYHGVVERNRISSL